ncbi:MAG TPA: CBS domain-containing protein [Anaerolineae bacterium]|nr:CBS domain-containing protein [Anaerolineae bacterium]HMR65660.1 CBS domain-containing protein [Anaerolineae bacterium]
MKKELVKNWMSRDVITVGLDTTVSKARHLMNTYKVRRFPVVHQGQLVGIVTLGDLRAAEPSDATSLSVWEVNYLLSQLTVQKIMTQNPMTISPFATISQAAWMMLEYKIGGLPVVDQDKQVVGIITESDIFRLVAQEWSVQETSGSSEYEVSV